MPTYTYECRHCAKAQDVVKSIKEFARKEKCGNCGRLMIRCYQKVQVVRDTYGQPLVMSAYHPIEGEKLGRPDTVQGRTELKRWLREYNQKHGTSLVRD